jgi:hypothetical protein
VLETYQWPVTVDGVQIGVADTRVLDVDKNLIWAGLLNRNPLVVDGSASLFNDLRPLLGRNGTHIGDLKLIREYVKVCWCSNEVIELVVR